ncbi:1-acyl-sn-glycerol-3-phosphate acyltransferase [Mixta intestinalis]|uniref:1-acyl-sn-glycerol-3-phosphate acyltransferase n=1 Tax=Mixta intestinalis TaxID=1615494 RepID=UPI0031379141
MFTRLVVWPVIWLWLTVKYSERLSQQGPKIIVANHNSHMDMFVLLSLFSLRTQQKVHPVAAADDYPRNNYLAWFTLNILNYDITCCFNTYITFVYKKIAFST